MQCRTWPGSAVFPLLSAILCIVAVSCATTNDLGKEPQAKQQKTGVASIDFYGSDLNFGWTFTNPYDHEIRLLSYAWELDVDGKRVQRGQSRQVRRLAAGSETTLDIPVSVKHVTLEKTLRTNSLPSQLSYRFIGKANLGAGVRSWSFDLNDEGQMNVLASPSLDIIKFHVTKMDTSRANVAVEILIRNPNTFATKLSNFSADFILGGQTVAQGVEGPTSEIAANGTAVIPLDLDLNFTRLGKVVYHALNQTETDFTLYGKTEVSTPWGTKKMNYDQSGKVKIER